MEIMKKTKRRRDKMVRLLTPKNEEERIELDALLLVGQYLKAISDILDVRGMLLKDLAEAVGVSRPYITQVFRGDKMPNFKFMAKVERALGIKFQISIELEGISPIASNTKTQLAQASKC